MFSSRYAPMENEQQQQKSQRSARQKSSRRTKSICSECPICFTTSTEIIQLSECQHIFCKACLVEYIQTQLSDFKVLKITCPQNDCNSLLNKSFLRKVLDDVTFDRYQKLFLQKLDNRKSKTKYCPKAGCSRPFDPQLNSSYTKCQCDTQICNFCDHIWHEGKSCLEALDPEFQLYAQENNAKLCIMCKTVVMRVEGCKHITCPICDYEWCWTCGREYKRGHDIVCVQEWSPEPPSKIIREYETKNLIDRLKLFLKPLMRFLMLLPVRMFLWAFWMTEAWWEMRSPERGTLEKIVIACCATTLSLLYIYAVGIMFYLFQKYPEDKRGFLTCLVVIIAIPWFIQGVINLYEIKKRKQRRWRTQDVNKFAYTNAHKPETAGQDLEQQGTSQKIMPINQDVTMMISNQTCEKSNIAFIQNNTIVKDAHNHKRSISQMDLSAFGWKGSPKKKHRIDFDPEP